MTQQKKDLSIGSWLSLGSPYVAEIMANAGFDWLVIDMEHSAANGLNQVQNLIQVVDLKGCMPLVRVPENDSTVIKQVMDAGAQGVLVPMVNTVEDAQYAVDSVHYPPQGKRGVGLWRAQDYGRSFDKYKEWIKGNGLVIVQIEHISAVQNLKNILEVNGVDGFIIGPYDLSASLGVPGEFEHPLMVQALKQVEVIIKTITKWAGCHIVHPNHQQLRKAIQDGYNFIAYGIDFIFLAEAIDSEIGFINHEFKKLII